MPRQLSLGLGFILLVLAAGAWFLGSEQGRVVSSVAPDTDIIDTDLGDSNDLTAAAVPEDGERRAVPESALPESSGETKVDLAARTPPGEELVRIRAVDGLTGAGLPGTRVSWANDAQIADVQARLADPGDPDLEGLVNACGNFAIADERAEVDVPAASTRIVARWREKVGIEYLDSLDAGDIRLWGERALELKVVDAKGAPVSGIPVQLSTEWTWGTGWTADEWGVFSRQTRDVCWRGVTGAEGSARIEGVESLLSTAFVRLPNGSFTMGAGRVPCEGLAEVRIPTRPAVSARIDPLAWPDGPVVLTLPAVGALIVHLVDAEGEPVVEGGYVQLETLGEPPSKQPYRQEASTGRARFDRVQLGERWRLGARFHGHRPGIDAEIEGPTAALPEREIRLVCSGENPLLSGRLLAADGEDFANAWFRLETVIEDPRGRESRTEVYARTDTTGSFQVSVRGDVVTGARASLRFVHPHTSEPFATRESNIEQAEVHVAAIDVARIELGTVRLQRIQR
jgi:hypothetical protein